VHKPAYLNSTVDRFTALFQPPYSAPPQTPFLAPAPPPEELRRYEFDNLEGRSLYTLGSTEELGVEDSNIEEGDGESRKRVILTRKSASLMSRF
jgi:hypothetical protein